MYIALICLSLRKIHFCIYNFVNKIVIITSQLRN